MIDEKTASICAAALEKYGGVNQRIVALEELAELQQALCRNMRDDRAAAHIAEEIADVEIMLEQLKLLYGMEDLVESWRERKLARLQSRIAGEEEPGSRLTKPDGDYCRDVCGGANSCKRLKEGGDRCLDAERYDRLRRYENTGWEPEEIGGKGG